MPTDTASPLILLVDDNPHNLQVLGNFLSEYRTAVATSGDEALGFVRKRLPDLILLDIMMPEMDGFEVCRRLKEMPETAGVSVIFLTAKSETSDMVAGFEAGAVDYIAKPFQKAELRARVQTHLRLKRAEETVRSALGEQRAAREAAERADRAKSDFLARMSHEIRTPLNAILGLTELALHSDPPPQQTEYLEGIMASSDHLLSVIDSILDMSKIEAGRIQLDPRDFDLPDLLTSVVHPQSHEARRKGLTLDLEEKDPDLPRYLHGDPVRLRQVLVNLLNNAVKFTEAGRVSLSVSMATEPEGGNGPPPVSTDARIFLRFSVKDTGIGISSDAFGAIFEPFHQKDRSISRKYGGAGLGLSICQHLVGLMGGDIRVESRPGLGSSFSFVVGFGPGDSGRASAGTFGKNRWEAAKTGRPLNILLAEDNDMNASIADSFLKRFGHRPHRVANGQAALTALNGARFDLVLMDIEMPDMDGIEASRWIRSGGAGEGNRRIPIIALTGHAAEDIQRRCNAAGIDAFIVKPVDFYRLEAVIRQVVSGRGGKVSEAEKIDGHSQMLDKKKALDLMAGDEKMLASLYRQYLKHVPQRMGQLEKAFYSHRMDDVALLAHSLKSVFGSIGSDACVQMAAALEAAAKENQADGIEPVYEKLLQGVAKLTPMIRRETGSVNGPV